MKNIVQTAVQQVLNGLDCHKKNFCHSCPYLKYYDACLQVLLNDSKALIEAFNTHYTISTELKGWTTQSSDNDGK